MVDSPGGELDVEGAQNGDVAPVVGTGGGGGLAGKEPWGMAPMVGTGSELAEDPQGEFVSEAMVGTARAPAICRCL